MERNPPETEVVTDRTAQDDRIRELYLARHSDQEIAEALGVHRTTVTRRRLALGITRADRKAAS